MPELDIQKYIGFFQEKMQPKGHGDGEGAAIRPCYPQLIVYLGDGALKAHETQVDSLLQTWPQFRNELKFLNIQRTKNGLKYWQISCDGKAPTPLTTEDMEQLVTDLFDIKLHFADRSYLLVYYILDSRELNGREDFLKWLDAIEEFKKTLYGNDIMDMLALFLNERTLQERRVSYQLRNCLSSLHQGDQFRACVNTVLLMSNRTLRNAVADWKLCYRALASAIVLSNNADCAAQIFRRAVLTVQYSRQEKPVRDICQVVVDALLTELAERNPPLDASRLDRQVVREKLGLTMNGTFTILDRHAEAMEKYLPEDWQLEYFPRTECTMERKYSARDFDAQTLGSWRQYLDGLTRRARQSMDAPANGYSWIEEYSAHLVNAFRREELIDLAEQLMTVKEYVIGTPREPNLDESVREAAKYQLKYTLSSDEELVDTLLNVLKAQGELAQDFQSTWEQLCASRNQLHDVDDGNIDKYYGRIVRDYCDHHDDQLRAEFSGAQSPEDLDKLLRKALEGVVTLDKVFQMDFYQEMKNRLNYVADPARAQAIILQKLTGNEFFHTYLQVNSGLGEPLVSSILMKKDTELYQTLQTSLGNDHYYYDTGNINSAEYLMIYKVSAANLIHEEVE